MEVFVKFINFLNESISNGLIFIGSNTPSFIRSFFNKILNILDRLLLKYKIKYDNFIDWIYAPAKKKKKKKGQGKNFILFIFSPGSISLTILASTIIFFHMQARRLSLDRPWEDVREEMHKLEQLRKPAFVKFTDREFFVDDIYFPIYVKTHNSIKRLILDLYLRASNRYIKKFFTENNSRNLDLIYDRLNLTTEQVIPHFPLTDEGKYIIKRKIKIELDILLKEIGIRGEIDEVFIYQIIGA